MNVMATGVVFVSILFISIFLYFPFLAYCLWISKSAFSEYSMFDSMKSVDFCIIIIDFAVTQFLQISL